MSSADWIELAIRCLSPFALGFIIGYVMNRHPLPRAKSPHTDKETNQ